MTYNLNLMN